MTLTRTAVAEIKTSAGIYRASDVARHYGVHRSTVCRIWQGEAHRAVPPADDFPDITTPLRGADLYEEVETLLDRGLTVDEVARAVGVSKRTVYKVRAARLGVY